MTDRTIKRLEAILAHVRQAHLGLHQAKEHKDALSDLMQYPYTPTPLQKVEGGHVAVNAAIGALLLLIRDLKHPAYAADVLGHHDTD